MKIYVGFARPLKPGLISKLIMLVQKSKFSHTYVKFYDKDSNRHIVYEAVGNGVHFIEYKNWLKENKPVQEIPLNITMDQYEEFREFCVDNCEVEYGYLVLFGIGLSKLLNLKRNPFQNKEKSYVCSELVATILKLFGYKFHKSLELISPQDINTLLLKK